ncbi:TPA: hypothetical protein N0F65_000175 [Lagenidium giganteum]|uniref:Uncharacterized protein n=1 Tax=Lagenidium giganteum TaxID=4803 RepID=A0AAV2YTC5_9STRA|nr:TPA: hypothetical protein N0F65_000175 [Lagenidium giganteum]
MDRLRRDHSADYLDEYEVIKRTSGTLNTFITVSRTPFNMYRWLEGIVVECLPLNFCRKNMTVKNTSLLAVFSKALKYYLNRIEQGVREHVAVQLKDIVLGLMLDAWTESGTHLVVVIAVTGQAQSVQASVAMPHDAGK